MTIPERLHLVFLEDRDQVSWIRNSHFFNPGITLIALTGEALQALEENGYPGFAVCDITDTSLLIPEEENYIRGIYALSIELEHYIGDHFREFSKDGPGVLSGSYYFLQYTISSLAKRALIYRGIINRFSPSKITILQKDINEWFLGCGYERNPWDDLLADLSKEYNFALEFQQVPRVKHGSGFRDHLNRYFSYYSRIRRKLRYFQRSYSESKSVSASPDRSAILFVNSTHYDWGPVIQVLNTNPGLSLYDLGQFNYYHEQWWSATFAPSVKKINSQKKTEFTVTNTLLSADEINSIETLVNSWIRDRKIPPEIRVLGTDIFPYLIPQIKTLAVQGFLIVSYTDNCAMKVIQKIKPDCVCFFNITLLSERRLAYLCEKNGIPTICYQHGFGYNVQIQPKDEGCDQACADFVLSYGEGDAPRENPLFSLKSEFIPVGSARIAEMLKSRDTRDTKPRRLRKILWIGESTSHNTIVASITEDTKRYRMQTESLKILSGMDGLRITYRPLISQLSKDGTSQWIKNQKRLPVTIDAFTPLEELIADSDLVIADISSPTTWGEVLGLRTSMILYCDPRQTMIKNSSINDLEAACCWCKTKDEFFATIKNLAADPEGSFTSLQKKDPTAFIGKYLLPDMNCAEKVCIFLRDRIFKPNNTKKK